MNGRGGEGECGEGVAMGTDREPAALPNRRPHVKTSFVSPMWKASIIFFYVLQPLKEMH